MIESLDLHAYADGELSPSESKRIEQLLEQDADSRAEVYAILNLKQAVSHHAKPVECSAEWKACSARIKELQKSHRTESFISRYAWSICGVFFVFILLGGVMNRLNPAKEMQAADLARVAAILSPAVGPRSQEPKEIADFLDRVVGEASKSIASDHLRVQSGGTGEIDGHRVAQINLVDSDGPLALIMINSRLDLNALSSATDKRFKTLQIQGRNAVAWTTLDRTMVLVGDRTYDELIDAAANKVVR